jgi:hypothetical protein
VLEYHGAGLQELEATRAAIKARSGRTPELYQGIDGTSVSIPFDLIHEIEFVQIARSSGFAVPPDTDCPPTFDQLGIPHRPESAPAHLMERLNMPARSAANMGDTR